jgi:hypothetical protein
MKMFKESLMKNNKLESLDLDGIFLHTLNIK